MEGIAKAKEKCVYKGRKPSVDVEKVKELRDSGNCIPFYLLSKII